MLGELRGWVLLAGLLGAVWGWGGQQTLPEMVEVGRIMEHLKELERISAAGGADSRSVRTNYNRSAEYVAEQLEGYCSVSQQHFVAPVHQELEQPRLALVAPYTSSFQHSVDFQGMRYGGSGLHNFTAPVTHLPRACSITDLVGFPAGHVALIPQGLDCELVDSALLVQRVFPPSPSFPSLSPPSLSPPFLSPPLPSPPLPNHPALVQRKSSAVL